MAQWGVLIAAHRQLSDDLAASRDECRRDHAAALARIAVLEAEREEDRRQIERLTAQVRDALDTLAARRTAPVD
jgi:cell division protein FtsB